MRDSALYYTSSLEQSGSNYLLVRRVKDSNKFVQTKIDESFFIYGKKAYSL